MKFKEMTYGLTVKKGDDYVKSSYTVEVESTDDIEELRKKLVSLVNADVGMTGSEAAEEEEETPRSRRRRSSKKEEEVEEKAEETQEEEEEESPRRRRSRKMVEDAVREEAEKEEEEEEEEAPRTRRRRGAVKEEEETEEKETPKKRRSASRSKNVPYNRDIAAHKNAFIELLDEHDKKWRADQEHSKSVSLALVGEDMFDAEGEILDSFVEKFKDAYDAE